ncbi:SPOR domain-containing protein [Candidatus Albibeggiatoa sp. nov. BB20]|uniref:SPOR domain-containing protein n=1 Tax=Candidatus Albibeggiatoa sp. nov. BB20 TaxID=3162723 RepID=UPI00336560EA
MAQNVRRPVSMSEPYDPKQRSIGGVVLALIMLLTYFFLQALVTLSIPAGAIQSSDGSYILSAIEPDEVTEEIIEDANGDIYVPDLPSSMSRFVFLDIDGMPFGTGNNEIGKNEQTRPIIGTHWVVQAASLKKYSRAEDLVTKLKAEGIDMEIKKIGTWYTVRTVAQRTEAEAKSMRKRLRQFGHKGLIKKIE